MVYGWTDSRIKREALKFASSIGERYRKLNFQEVQEERDIILVSDTQDLL